MTLAELAEELRSGAITVSQWETSMRDFLRSEYETALILAKGGRENVTFSDWGYEGSLLKKQYQYLSNFAKEISANPTAWMSGRLDARMNMYGNSAYGALEDFQRREAEAQGYDEEIRHLTPAEHCPDCLDAAEHWEPIGTLPPIGDSVCLVNCKCVFEFRKTGDRVSAPDSVGSFEKGIDGQEIETAAVFDKDGNIVFQKDGNNRQVSFTKEEAEQMRGNTLTHNHPARPGSGGGSFSFDDINLFTNYGLSEIRAIDDNYTYLITGVKNTDGKISKALFTKIYKDEVMNGTATTVDDLSHNIVVRYADKYGLTYERIPK